MNNDAIIDEFRANAGRVGGVFSNRSLLLLHTVGARSGIERVNPLVYITEQDRYIVAASKGGAPGHPDWYFNLMANPDVSIEVGTETMPARAVVLEGAERDRLYAALSAEYGFFADYAKQTARVIPVVALVPERATRGR